MDGENQRVRITKLLLKETLEELLKQKPITRITVKEICSSAGINRSTFYQHYADQYALLGEIEDDIIRQADEFIGKISPEKGGRQYLVELAAFVRRNGAILSLLLTSGSGMSFQNKFMACVLKKLSTADPELYSSELMPYFSQFLIMGNISVIRQWITDGFSLSDEKAADLLFCLSEGVVKAFDKIEK